MQSNLNEGFGILWEQLVLVVLNWFGYLSQWNSCISQVCRLFTSLQLLPLKGLFFLHCAAPTCFVLLLMDVFSCAPFWRVDLVLCECSCPSVGWRFQKGRKC